MPVSPATLVSMPAAMSDASAAILKVTSQPAARRLSSDLAKRRDERSVAVTCVIFDSLIAILRASVFFVAVSICSFDALDAPSMVIVPLYMVVVDDEPVVEPPVVEPPVVEPVVAWPVVASPVVEPLVVALPVVPLVVPLPAAAPPLGA